MNSSCLPVKVLEPNRLAHDDNFRDAIPGQELAVTGPGGEQPLDAAVGKCALNGKLLRQLHLHIVAGGDVEAAVQRLLAMSPGVEKGQYLPARIHGRIQML